MATETGGVRVEVGRNCHRQPAACGAMTRRATDPAHRHMPRVIELHAKAHQSIRKRLYRAGLRISVTDGADRTF